MTHRLIRDGDGREVARVVTPSGVVGYISLEVTSESLRLMAAKLRRKLRKTLRSTKDPKLRAAIAVGLGDVSTPG